MPNRIIKESAFTSDKIAQLSDFEFRLWVGLITQADDAGRGDARPAIIKGRVFALRERTTLKDIDNALHTLAAYGCVSLYTVGGKPYYAFPNWAAHQRVRDVKPRYPGADESDDYDNLPQSAANCGELRPKSNPIQSNPNTESESESKSNPNPPISPHGGSDDAFDVFWKAYPKKVGKAAAKKAFRKVKVPLESLLSAIERQKCGSQWSRDNGQYIPNPATWLNQERWEDEEYRTPADSRTRALAPHEYKGRDFFDDE